MSMASIFFNKEKQAEECLKRGICYKNGEGVEKDLVKAVECFMKAAEMGHAEAQNRLG